MTPREKKQLNEQAKRDFERDDIAHKESTAQEVVNELMRSILPSVRYAIGKAVAGWSHTGLAFEGGELTVVNERVTGSRT